MDTMRHVERSIPPGDYFLRRTLVLDGNQAGPIFLPTTAQTSARLIPSKLQAEVGCHDSLQA